MPPTSYVAGLDLGQAQDYSALAIVEAGPVGPDQTFDVRHLHRWPLGTRYPAIVDDVAALLAAPEVRGRVRLAIDATGVGAAVVDLFRGPRQPAQAWQFNRGTGAVSVPPPTAPPPPIVAPIHAITITGGTAVARTGRDAAVPKRDLVGAVVAPLQGGRLRIAPELPEAATLTRELRDFRAKISLATGHDSYGVGEEWRVGQHDDLVLALAMAVWVARNDRSTVIRSY